VPTLVGPSDFPRHRLSQCSRIPHAIIERNGERECTEREGAAFAGSRFARRTRAEIYSPRLAVRPVNWTVSYLSDVDKTNDAAMTKA
jgi:hypothetical protein